VTPYNLVDGYQFYGETCVFHSQDHFYLQHGDNRFPRNFGGLLPDYTVSQLWSPQFKSQVDFKVLSPSEEFVACTICDILMQNTKGMWGKGGGALHIFSLCTGWWEIIFKSRPPYPWYSWYSLAFVLLVTPENIIFYIDSNIYVPILNTEWRRYIMLFLMRN